MNIKVVAIAVIVIAGLCASNWITFQAYVGKAEQVKIDQANEKAYTDSLQVGRDKQGREVVEKYALQKTVADLKDNQNDLRILLKSSDLKLKNLLATSDIQTRIDTFLWIKTEKFSIDSTYHFVVNPEFKADVVVKKDSACFHPFLTNTQTLAFANKRETIKPPKKFFLWRLFQAKHTVVKVIVRNSNTAIKTNSVNATFIIKK